MTVPATPAQPPGQPPPPDPTPPPAPPVPPAQPPTPPPAPPTAVTFKSQDEFNKRIAQAARAQLREMGVEDPAKLKGIIEEHEKMRQAAEEQRQKDMSELEREREQRQRFEQEATDAKARAKAATERAEHMQIIASKGIKHTKYAMFELAEAKSQLAKGDAFDAAKTLDDLLEDPRKKVAFGIEAPPVTEQGVTNTDTAQDPPPPPAGGGKAPQKSAKDLSPDEFREQVRRQYNISM